MKYKKYYALLLALCMSLGFCFPEAYAASAKASEYPPRVKSVKATSAGHDSIKLTWKKASGAKGYKIYRSTKKNGTYKLVKTTNKTSFTNKKLTSNKTYYYKVKAYKTVKNKTYTSKKYSTAVSAKALLTKATGLKVTQKSSTSVKLTWKAGKNTKYYAVYRKEGKNGKYKKIKATSAKSYTDKKLTAGNTYYYKVRAYNKRGDRSQYAAYSKYVKTKLSLPTEETTTELASTEATTTDITTTEAPTTSLSTENYIKDENVEKAKAYIEKLYTDALSDDYTKMCFPWERVNRKTNWIYYTGLVFDALLQTDFEKYPPFMKDFYNQYITDDGKIKTYAQGELDSAMLGAPLLEILKKGDLTEAERERYTAGTSYIYNELQKQTIYTEAGNLWLHSQKADGTPRPAWVKWNICLDGIYMSQIFLIRLTEAIDKGVVSILKTDGSLVTGEELWADIYSRLSYAAESFRDEETGLLYHGYCVETKETNGAFWSRGIGWYTMVLLEAAEKMPDKEKRERLASYFTDIMSAVTKYQDEKTSLWYNVTDGKEEYCYTKKTDNGEEIIYNIPEASGSAMFTYCLLRGYNSGILKDETFRISGLKGFNALVEDKLFEDGLQDVYTSSSVTSDKNLYQKNGYTTNDGKGVGPFIMATKYVY